MRIVSVEVLAVRLPFRFTFRHALAARAESLNVLVCVADAEGRRGWGESVPRDYVTGETPASVRDVIGRRLAPPLVGRGFAGFDEVVAALAGAVRDRPRDHNAASCALELAVLDLAGRAFGCSAGEVSGPVRRREVRYSGVLTADGAGPGSGSEVLARMARFGFPSVKLKVGLPGADDLAVLRRARELLGEACGLRIDANCAWTPEQALRRLEEFAPFRLQGVEQPVAADDLAGLAWLTARSPVPVIVDESLASPADARRLIEAGACHHFNLRVSKCGGLIAAVEIRRLARAAGLGCQLGAQAGEAALLSAAGRQLATRGEPLLFLEGSYGTLLLEEDLGATDVTIGPGGRATSLEGPGLGVEIDPGRVERHVVERVTVASEG